LQVNQSRKAILKKNTFLWTCSECPETRAVLSQNSNPFYNTHCPVRAACMNWTKFLFIFSMGKTFFQIKILKNVLFFKRAFNIHMNVKFFVWFYWRYLVFNAQENLFHWYYLGAESFTITIGFVVWFAAFKIRIYLATDLTLYLLFSRQTSRELKQETRKAWWRKIYRKRTVMTGEYFVRKDERGHNDGLIILSI